MLCLRKKMIPLKVIKMLHIRIVISSKHFGLLTSHFPGIKLPHFYIFVLYLREHTMSITLGDGGWRGLKTYMSLSRIVQIASKLVHMSRSPVTIHLSRSPVTIHLSWSLIISFTKAVQSVCTFSRLIPTTNDSGHHTLTRCGLPKSLTHIKCMPLMVQLHLCNG